jgi:hypothetical protein
MRYRYLCKKDYRRGGNELKYEEGKWYEGSGDAPTDWEPFQRHFYTVAELRELEINKILSDEV